MSAGSLLMLDFSPILALSSTINFFYSLNDKLVILDEKMKKNQDADINNMIINIFRRICIT